MPEEKKEENKKQAKRKIFKHGRVPYTSSLRIVSMIPGDRKVAGCFVFSSCFGGFKWRIH
ncbi:hypothetical protein A3K73_09375 [Candidatus Pacearchaeota archaeon RBG_13_36_9]|nr:MAG: hypothetical protein A3K73_09375 [Candidatus Pacearchaeota archaeon RBG_13_36_9]